MNSVTRVDSARRTLASRNSSPKIKTERRESPRYPVNADTSCPFVLPVLEDYGPARIKDISTDGIGLLVQQKMEPGLLIAVGLMNSTQNFCRTQLVQIVHCTPMGGLYHVGGTFLTPLSYEELRTYLM